MRRAVVLVLVLAVARLASAATISVVNGDGANEGFNDTTPVAPVGGNPGTTLGQQRLAAFNHAAGLWAAVLQSPVEIRVAAKMDPDECDASSAILGSAAPITVHRDFTGAPAPLTWFPQALANACTGEDMDVEDDIFANFNSAIGTTCPFPITWYYGLDANAGEDQFDFVSVVAHELGHGLGFLTLVDLDTGAKFLGLNDAFMVHLENHTTVELFPAMTNAERFAASIATGNLHWVGPAVVAAGGGLAAGRHASGHVEMYAPAFPEPGSSVSHFSDALAPDELMEPVYTVPTHDLALTLAAFADMGWNGCALPSTTTTTTLVPPEFCNNLVDDNADGSTDCADPVCAADPACGACLPAATFDSLTCRLAALIERVRTAPDVGALQGSLLSKLGQARDRAGGAESACSAGSRGGARRQVVASSKRLKAFRKRLLSRPGRRNVSAARAGDLLVAAERIQGDLRALRTRLLCR